MKFSVYSATLADCPALATLSLTAFKDDPIVGLLSRDVPPDVMDAYQRQLYQRRMQMSSLNSLQIFKVVDDETGEIVGLSRWQFPYTLTAEQQAEKNRLEEAAPKKPEGYNIELAKEFFEALEKRQDKWVDYTKDYSLVGLAVSPTHQRRGLGSLLIRDGLAKADKAGAKTRLASSAAGLSLYLKHGFKQVDDVLIDMRPYGGTGIASEKCMMREPGGR